MRYNEDTCAIEMSVRSLCEGACHRGDLGGYFSADGDTAVDGGAIHRKLQSEAGGFYNPEVTLTNTTLFDGLYFTVSGRADGVIRHPDGLEVDEIKCVHSAEFYAPLPREVYLAQMKCYAYFLALREELPEIRGRLTYYHAETKKIKYFHYRFTTEELRAHYEELLASIVRFAHLTVRRKIEVLPSAAWVKFPYPELREGQELMIRESFSAIRKGKRLFVEAPTGTGKTMSSLYPAVRALGSGEIDKIFYLTAKASTRREAYRAASLLFETGAKLKAVVITAKEQLCQCQGGMKADDGRNHCNGEDCERARGYYDRRDEALLELLESRNGFPRQIIVETAKKYGICPYELSLDLSEYCDIVICDYNYAFDPSVYFRRYFGEGGKGEKYAFLIDEAHNLADRARDMYSAVLCRSEFEGALSALQGEPKLLEYFSSVMISIGRLRELCREEMVKDAEGNEQGFYLCRSPLTNLNTELEIFRRRIDFWLKQHEESPLFGVLYPLSSHVRKYLSVNEFFDDGFLTYVELSHGDLTVKTYCLDPSPIMDALLNRAKASILFSATLTPPEYFCDVLGGAKRAESISLPSPFDTENLGVAVADYLSTRFDDREKNDARYASVIAATVSAKAGNYIAYFPSYELLDRVKTAFCRKYPKVEVIVQKQGMGLREKEEFLQAFREDRGHLRVGFCVLGGAFSEGVDLPGSRLIGSIVFGVGIPGLSNERNMIQEYFDREEGQGYDYAYTYPGMTRVLQAVGRVIRQESDCGVAVLVDDRYATPKYRAMFPSHWQGVQYAGNARSLAEIMRRFWEKRDKTEKN